MAYRKIVAGPYPVFTTRTGPLVEVLREEWKTIWSTRPRELGGHRAFATDYEIYDQRSANPERALIEIHIGLKHID
jgi:predicted transcriptional regulator YdeE